MEVVGCNQVVIFSLCKIYFHNYQVLLVSLKSPPDPHPSSRPLSIPPSLTYECFVNGHCPCFTGADYDGGADYEDYRFTEACDYWAYGDLSSNCPAFNPVTVQDPDYCAKER